MPWFHWKKRMATEFAIGLSCVGRDVGTLSEIDAKTDQHCRAEHCLAIDMEWFATGVHWLGNPVISKETSIICCCSWWTFWTPSLNTERVADIYHWNVWTVDEKVVQSLIRYYWIFTQDATVSLNCCIYWTTSVISMKFAGYVAWILICKLWEFGEKSATIPDTCISNFS